MVDETLKILSPRGVEFELTDYTDFFNLKGMNGHNMPPYEIVAQATPGQEGATVENVKVGARPVDIPLLIIQESRQELIDIERLLSRELSPVHGESVITYTDTTGAGRELRAHLIGGLRGDTSKGAHGPAWARKILVFEANEQVYWEALSAISGSHGIGEIQTWGPTVLPLVLTDSSVFTSFEIDNVGDVEAWPLWQIDGPGNTIILENESTGKITSLPITLALGEFVNIDTRPRHKTVIKNGTTNIYSLLDKTVGSSLWPLQSGSNQIKLQMNGATGISLISIQFTPRYEGL